MRYLLILLTMLSLTSCGRKTELIVGTPGADGTSCYAETRDGSNFVVCGDEEFEVRDGAKGDTGDQGPAGEDGIDGQDGSFDGYIELVQLCPEHVPGNKHHIETLLYLDGKYMAFLSSDEWEEQRLVLLEESRQYQTTDGRDISFTIVDGEIVYTSHMGKCE